MVDVGHAPGDGVLHGDHAEIRRAGLHRLEGVFEGGAGQGLIVRKMGAASFVAIGAQFSLEGDRSAHGHAVSVRAQARARSKSWAVSTEMGGESITAAQIDRPSSSARSCSSFSRRSSGEGGAALNRSSAARR